MAFRAGIETLSIPGMRGWVPLELFYAWYWALEPSVPPVFVGQVLFGMQLRCPTSNMVVAMDLGKNPMGPMSLRAWPSPREVLVEAMNNFKINF